MNPSEEIQYVELSLEEAKKVAAFGEALERLEKNKDFRTVILEGYFSDEARRLTFLTADSSLDDRSLNAVWAGIRGIGELRQYLMSKRTQAQVAQKEIQDFQGTLDELREEDAGSGEVRV